jgi:hypothetical protein
MADNDRGTEIAELEKQVTDLEAKIAKLDASGDETGDDVKKTKVERVRLSKAFGKTKKDEEADDEEPDADEDDWSERFASKTKKAAEAEMKKGEDESVTIEGQTIAKSAVGEAAFAVLKVQADQVKKSNERLEKAEAEIAKERDLRETAELKKRADDEFPHVPGTLDERASMLKALGKMDEAVQKTFTAALTQAEKLAKSAFDRVGMNGGDMEALKKGAKGFEDKVSEIRKRDECTRTEAMERARKEDPDSFKAYQSANSN